MASVAQAMSKTRHRNQIPAISQPRNLDANPRCELNGFSHPTRLPNPMIRNPQSLEDKYAQLAFDTAFRCKENNSNCQTPASDSGAADTAPEYVNQSFALIAGS
jgi:hypothetical protein